MNPFPHIDFKGEKPKDGSVFDLPIFCKRHFNSNCINHYKAIWNKDGFHKCPYGFTTHVSNRKANTGLAIEKQYDKRKFKKNKNKRDFIAKMNLVKYDKIIKECIKKDEDYKIGSIINLNDQPTVEFLDDTLHEIRKLNKNLKVQAEFLQKESQYDNIKKTNLRDRAYNIFSTSQLISIRLNTYDFSSNPDLALNNQIGVKVYKKFEKAYHTLKLAAEEAKVSIKFEGKSIKNIKGYNVFELLPYILLENAIKYSSRNSVIECLFKESDEKLQSIKIQNYAFLPSKSEIDSLTLRGFRAKCVRKQYKGSGIGLHIANIICDVHNIDLEINCKYPKDPHKENQYGLFEVLLKFN